MEEKETVSGSPTKHRDSEGITFSVIIPALNEEHTIGRCLACIHTADPSVEIIVADGGSADRTVSIAEQQKAIICLSEPGRGMQCNAGAAIASGNVLVFLHADSRLPSDALARLRDFLKDERVKIGTFPLRFDLRHWFLDACTRFGRFDSIMTRFGDQCIVVRKSFFIELGGFRQWPLFEDVNLLQRARRRTRIHWLPGEVTTSARRHLRNGIIRQQLRNGWYLLQYCLGVPPERLAVKYCHARRNSNGTALILFVRYPVAGKVKTRLAKSVGADAAATFYRLCAERLFSETSNLRGMIRRYVFCADNKDLPKVRRWAGGGFWFEAQSGRDLGERIANAFATVFEHGADRAVILASDTPDLTGDLINAAIGTLAGHDVVIGPCYDGGYYLLGLKRLYHELFAGISWSTEKVFQQTLEAASKLRLAIHVLPSLTDIDTEDDLRLWSKETSVRGHSQVHEFAETVSR